MKCQYILVYHITHSPALQTSPCVRHAIINSRVGVATKQGRQANREAPTSYAILHHTVLYCTTCISRLYYLMYNSFI